MTYQACCQGQSRLYIINNGIHLAQSWQSNADVLYLSKLTFQHGMAAPAELQEPSINFNLASLFQ